MTPSLIEQHWLYAIDRVNFKVVMLSSLVSTIFHHHISSFRHKVYIVWRTWTQDRLGLSAEITIIIEITTDMPAGYCA